MNVVSLLISKPAFARHEALVRRRAFRILKQVKQDGVFVEIHLEHDSMMRLLNRRLRGKFYAANILSFREPIPFPRPDAPRGKRVLGEIYLNPGFVAEWQKRGKKKNVFPLDALLAHGLLHLLGFKHARKSDRIRMERMERRIMNNES
ncbi:rRNA maturation RNase YbeY [Candidatus Wolfebacteria bacterium]|nr:rRNA maturation RNase YbeY [Candidatus Wolfebacteria bacterium]